MTDRSALASPRLRALAAGERVAMRPAAQVDVALAWIRGGTAAAASPGLVCELCAEPIPERHRHLVDLERRVLCCVCRACSILFHRREAGFGHYRLVPERVRRLNDFDLPAPLWQALRIPVDMAFFFHDSEAGRVVAFYPGPAGAVEARLDMTRWSELASRNPALSGMQPDVEALLVDCTGAGERYWLVPVDVCYELVGLIRASWKGLAGGREVWDRLAAFTDELSRRAATDGCRAADRV